MLSIEIYIWLMFTALLLIIIFEKLIIWVIKKFFSIPYKLWKKIKEKKSLRELKEEFIKKEMNIEDSKEQTNSGEKTGNMAENNNKWEKNNNQNSKKDELVITSKEDPKIKTAVVTKTIEDTKKKDEKIKANIQNELLKRKVDRLLIEADRHKKRWDVNNYEKKLVECLSLVPDEPVVLDNLSDLYLNLWKDKKAFPLLKKLIQKDVNNDKAIWNLSKIYLNNSEMDTSLLLIEKAIELRNDNPRYWITKAEIVYNKDNLEEAIEYAKSALKLRPENLMYIEWVAMLYEEIWDKTRAKKYRLMILDLEPNYEIAREKLTE